MEEAHYKNVSATSPAITSLSKIRQFSTTLRRRSGTLFRDSSGDWWRLSI